LQGAKSVIVIGVNYYQEAVKTPAGYGKIARYAWGRDYHKILQGILKKLESFIANNEPGAQCKICVDSSPLLEKNYAVRAGLGFIGKNTTLINPQYGSFIVLGELLTTQKLEYDKPIKGTCGNCTRCLDVCPTKALIAAGEMDARRCISYLTIENKGAIKKSFQKNIGNRLFGCDTCQEACPYNQTFAKPTTNPDFKKTIAGSSLPLKEIAAIKTDTEFLNRFAGSPLMRAKRKGLQSRFNSDISRGIYAKSMLAAGHRHK
jgi:epoxyqueuosine reductase